MLDPDASRRIANNKTIPADWPADLGYFMAYRFAQAFYDQAQDKQAALQTLFYVDDPQAILEKSGNAKKFQ
ncbi:MAG: hypothetical protein H6510_06765 [Acidobacteria bacterium]|nr:hypothetical protein [Acidobacteriota bacterium]